MRLFSSLVKTKLRRRILIALGIIFVALPLLLVALSGTTYLVLNNKLEKFLDKENYDWFEASADWETRPDPMIEQNTLDNGFRWTLVEDSSGDYDTVEIRLIVYVGRRHQSKDQLGYAHLLEHLAFNGTEHFPQRTLDHLFAGFGMEAGNDINAYINDNETVYRLSVPSHDPELVAKALQLAEDWIHGITLSADEVEAEKPVVVEELRWRDRWGWKKEARSVEKATAEGLRAFYEHWYQPQLMQLLVVAPMGVVSREQLNHQFADIQSQALEDIPPRKSDNFRYLWTLFTAEYDKDVHKPNWTFKYPVLKADSSAKGIEWDFARQIAVYALVERLENTLKANSYDLFAGSSYISRSAHPQTLQFSLYNNQLSDKELIFNVARIMRELTQQGINEEEYKTAAQTYRNRLVSQGRARGSSPMDSLYAFNNDLLQDRPLVDYYSLAQQSTQMHKTIPLEQINLLIREGFKLDQMQAHRVSNEKTSFLKLASWVSSYRETLKQGAIETDTALESIETDKDNVELAKPSFIIPEKTELELIEEQQGKFVHWRNQQGLEVYFLPTEDGSERLDLRFYVLGGRLSLDDRLQAASYFWATYWRETQLGTLSRKELGNYGLSSGRLLNKDFTGSDSSGSRWRLRDMLSLVAAPWLESIHDEQAFNEAKRQLLDVWQGYETPETLAQREYLAQLDNQDAASRFYQRSVLEKVEFHDLQALRDQLIERNAGLVMIITGDDKASVVKSAVEERFAGLPFRAGSEFYRTTSALEESFVRDVAVNENDIVDIELAYSLDEAYSPETERKLELLETVLNISAGTLLREELGTTYGLSVRSQSAQLSRSNWLLNLKFSTGPETEELALNALHTLLAQSSDTGFTETQLVEAKQIWLRNYQETFSAYHATRRDRFADILFNGEQPSAFWAQEELINSITAEELRELLEKFLEGETGLLLERVAKAG